MVLSDCKCRDCGAVTEHWVKPGQPPTDPCPHCGSPALERQIGAPHLNYTDMAANGESSSDAMGTAVNKWAKMREQKQKIEKRNLERHGTYE